VKLENSLSSGMMTNQPSLQVADLRKMKCELNPNEEGWFYKYIDPAGSVESHRAIGSSAKVPDGLVTFSVDAEIRTIRTLSVPGQIPGELPILTPGLNTQLWSLAIISYPLFRTGYIAVANKLNAVISDAIAQQLVSTINNLYDYQELIRSEEWIPFGNDGEGWYYQIATLPPTNDAPDPIEGETRTVSAWRMSYKSITIESNAPDITDQGLCVGGQYALETTDIAEPTNELMEVPTSVIFTRENVTSLGSSLVVRIPNLAQVTLGGGPGQIAWGPTPGVIPDASRFAVKFPATATLNYFDYQLADGETWYSAPQVIWASPNDVIRFSAPALAGTTVSIVNVTAPTTSLSSLIGAGIGSSAVITVYVNLPRSLQSGGTAKSVELPAYNTTQISANNPKFEQFQIHESGGLYLVHRKMKKPVFDVTPAQSYGPVVFTCPGTLSATSQGTGLLDTMDSNFSTAVAVLTGIAYGNNPIIKLYQGWEGVTNNNTTLGQFGHAGLARNDELLSLIDSLSTQTTGVYAAKMNFAAALCSYGAQLLRSMFKSEATQGMMRNIANTAVDYGLRSVNRRLG